MKLGNNITRNILVVFILTISFSSFAEDKILSSPLINLDQIKPSFENSEEKIDKDYVIKDFKTKKKRKNLDNSPHAVLIGLDKITAKSSEITINFNETKTFGPLEIKILRCGKVKVNNKLNDVAYMQVKDMTKNQNEQVFIFNGWTFSSDPNLTPFDHAIYDLQLVNCFDAQ